METAIDLLNNRTPPFQALYMAIGTDSSIETNSTEINVTLSNIQNTQEFMEEIQKYPVLYDKFSKDFKDKYKKQIVWMSAISTFSTTP